MREVSTGLLLAAIVAFSFAALVSIGGAMPGACVLCHSAEAEARISSAHANVNCHLCHQRPGVWGVLEQRTRMVPMFTASALPGRSGQPAVVHSAECLACHAGVLTDTLEKDAIRVRHVDFVEAGHQCVSCHSAVTHGDTVAVVRVPTMDVCISCHDGMQAPDACDTCHVQGERRPRSDVTTPWRILHGPTWRYTHGLGDQATCRTCHPTGYCSRCHGVDLPHPPSWMNVHGRGARSAPQSCMSCHDEELCTGCHEVDMPHPEGFLPQHSAEVERSGSESCLGCHLEVSCDACHEAHIHPGLTPRQIEMLRRTATRS